MPSSYTTNLRLTLPATGENNGTWGSLVNTGITTLVDTAIAGTANVTMSDANYTLTTANGTTDQARCMFINLSGTLSAARNVICPNASKLYFVYNGTTGGRPITFKTASGSGVTVQNGKRATLYCDGVNVGYAFSQVALSPTVTISGDIDGAASDYAVSANNITVKSNVTTLAAMFNANPSTEATAFTLTSLQGFRASQGTIGAGSTVTRLTGFYASGNLVGGQKNFGFSSDIDTQPAVNIASVNGTGTTVTVNTSAAHNLTNGDTVLIAQVPETLMTSGSYNGGPYTITVSNTTTFSYTSTATSSAPVTTGGVVVRANRWNFYAGGTGQNYFGGATIVDAGTSLDAFRISQSGSGNAIVVEDTTNPDSSPFVIDSIGRAIIGFTSPIASADSTNTSLQVHGVTTNTSSINLSNWSATGSNEPSLYFSKSNSGGIGQNTLVANSTALGRISFAGNDGTKFVEAARISASVNGTPGADDMPGRLVFSTTADGAATPTTRMTIAQDGTVNVTGNFSAGNVLGGTWTPTITAVTNVAASSALVCQYIRVGSVVSFSGYITIQSTATGNVEFEMSLPVASDFSGAGNAAGTLVALNYGDSSGAIYANPTTDRMVVRLTSPNTTSRNYTFSGSYRII